MKASRATTWKSEVLTASRFGLVGISATLLHGFVAYAVLLVLNWSLLFANSVAFLVAAVWSYVGHARWTFEQKRLSQPQFSSFLLAALFVYGVTSASILIAQGLALPDNLGLVLAVVFGSISSFVVNRFLIFTSKLGGEGH